MLPLDPTDPPETNHGSQSGEHHSAEDSFGGVNQGAPLSTGVADNVTMVFERTRTVPRTCSVELVVRSCGPDSLPDTSRYGNRSVTGTRHLYTESNRESNCNDHDRSLGVSLPTTIRCSSLGCLPAPHCATPSTGGMARSSTRPGLFSLSLQVFYNGTTYSWLGTVYNLLITSMPASGVVLISEVSFSY